MGAHEALGGGLQRRVEGRAHLGRAGRGLGGEAFGQVQGLGAVVLRREAQRRVGEGGGAHRVEHAARTAAASTRRRRRRAASAWRVGS